MRTAKESSQLALESLQGCEFVSKCLIAAVCDKLIAYHGQDQKDEKSLALPTISTPFCMHLNAFCDHSNITNNPISALCLCVITLSSISLPLLLLNISLPDHHSSLGSVFFRELPSFLVELVSLVLELLSSTCLDGIIRYRFCNQGLNSSQDSHNFRGRLPDVGLEDTDAHSAVLVEGDIGVVDAGFERDLGWLEGIFVGQKEGEGEFAALK